MIQNRKYMKILLHLASELEVIIILTSLYELCLCRQCFIHVWHKNDDVSGCLAPNSAQGSTIFSTAVANVQVSMDEKVSFHLHGTTAALLSVAASEAQFCTGLDDAILFKMDAGPVQRPVHCDHREVSVEVNGFFEVKRRLQEQRGTSEGRGFVPSGSGGKGTLNVTKTLMLRGWRTKIRTCELVIKKAASTCRGNQKSEDVCQTLLQSPKEHLLTGSSPYHHVTPYP